MVNSQRLINEKETQLIASLFLFMNLLFVGGLFYPEDFASVVATISRETEGSFDVVGVH